MSRSIYQVLDSLNSEIRVLHIRPAAKPESPIICDFQHIFLTKSHSYEALSYTWGLPGTTVEITVNGVTRRVQENAGAAIRRLRDPKKTRVVWIDAICINQENDEEKGLQVLLMREIYGKADQVCVWLGESSEGSDVGISFLRNNNFALGWKQWRKDRKHGNPTLPWLQTLGNSVATQNRTNLLYEQATGEVRELLDRPWWKRVWIVQEAILARKLILMCGSDKLEWNSIEKTIARLRLQGGVVFGFSESPTHAFPDEIYRTINTYRDRMSSTPDGLSLYDILYRCRSLHCTDPRDRIYGFLGLIPATISKVICPDYGSPTAEVYRKFARLMIEVSGSLDVLNCKREWQIEKSPPAKRLAYSLLDQARYHDTNALIIDGPDQKPRRGWARLPPGWERKINSKGYSVYFVNHLTGEQSQKSPLEDEEPNMAQNMIDQKKLPSGWYKAWDNFGCATVSFSHPSALKPDEKPTGLEYNPSWAPNWAHATDKDPAPFLQWSPNNSSYWAAGKGSFTTGVGIDDRVLQLDGLAFDTIELIAAPWHPNGPLPPVSRKGVEVLETWEALAIANVIDCPYNGDRKNALWRTMIADHVGDQAAPNDDWAYVETWYDRVGWAEDPASTSSMSIWETASRTGDYSGQSVKMIEHFYEHRPLEASGGVIATIKLAYAAHKTITKTYTEFITPVCTVHCSSLHGAILASHPGMRR